MLLYSDAFPVEMLSVEFPNNLTKGPAKAGPLRRHSRRNPPGAAHLGRIIRILESPPARRTVGLGFGLVDLHSASLHIGFIKALDCRIRFRVIVHFDEAEAFGSAAELVGSFPLAAAGCVSESCRRGLPSLDRQPAYSRLTSSWRR